MDSTLPSTFLVVSCSITIVYSDDYPMGFIESATWWMVIKMRVILAEFSVTHVRLVNFSGPTVFAFNEKRLSSFMPVILISLRLDPYTWDNYA